jgi:putative ABC transport system permease protein
MFNSYFTIALRQLRKHPSTTAIHLLGLTVGLTTCLLICLFLYHEWGVDRHQPQVDRTYRVNLVSRNPGQVDYSGITPYPMGDALRTDFSDWPVVASVHLEEENFVVISPQKILSEERSCLPSRRCWTCSGWKCEPVTPAQPWPSPTRPS